MHKLHNQLLTTVCLVFFSAVTSAAPLWQSYAAYQAEDIVTFEGRDYKAIKGHITSPTWVPSRSPSLWLDIGAATAVSSKNNTPTLNVQNQARVVAEPVATREMATPEIIESTTVPSYTSAISAAKDEDEKPTPNVIRFSSTTLTNSNNVVAQSTEAPSTPASISNVQIIQKCAAPWASNVVYAAGDVISLGGNNYQAKSQNADKNPKRISSNIFSAKYWKKRKDYKNWNNQGPCSNSAPSVSPDTSTKPAITPTPTIKPTTAPTPVVTAKPTTAPTPVATTKPSTAPTPAATTTAKPSVSPTPTSTSQPVATPVPTATAQPVATPTPAPGLAIPVIPVFTPVANSDTSILLTWAVISNATSYVITRNGSLIHSPTITTHSGTSSFIDTGLTAVTAYTYTVQACNALGCSSVGTASPISTTAPNLLPTTLPTIPCGGDSCLNQPEDLLLNDFSFRKRLIQENMIPYLDLDAPSVIDYIREPTTSYNNASAKGNDQASTKKDDLVRWYRNIRHASGLPNNPYREFDGGAIFNHPPVFASQAPFNTAEHDVGVYKREFLENRLDFYNFFRALYGAQRSYISNYKQTNTQAGAWLGRQVVPAGGSGHAPNWTIANEKYGIKKATFDAGLNSRASANIQVGNTGGDQSNLNHFNSNSRLSIIWNEGESDALAGLGHRHVFLDEGSKDIGFGVYNWSLVWTVWGSNPQKDWGWNSLTEKAYHTKYPATTAQQGVEMWHSHGYYPFFAAGGNQSINAKPSPSYVSPLTLGEQVKLKIELFHSQKDGDLSVGSPILGAPLFSIELSDIYGTTTDEGGESPVGASVSDGKDWVGKLPTHPLGGRWHFTTARDKQLRFRMPEKMWETISAGFNKAAPEQKNYYTVRYAFTTNGNGLKIVKPFYMNQTIGAPLILQTTYFDMSRE